MRAIGDRVLVNDELEEERIVGVFENEHRMALPFSASLSGVPFVFEGATAP